MSLDDVTRPNDVDRCNAAIDKIEGKPSRPLSADASRVLARIPFEQTSERELRRQLRDGLFLPSQSIGQILNALTRRGLIDRGCWINDDRAVWRVREKVEAAS